MSKNKGQAIQTCPSQTLLTIIIGAYNSKRNRIRWLKDTNFFLQKNYFYFLTNLLTFYRLYSIKKQSFQIQTISIIFSLIKNEIGYRRNTNRRFTI